MEKYAQKNIKAISSFMHFCCRTPPGVRGLKYQGKTEFTNQYCRTPPGVRGLKYGKINVAVNGKAGRTPPGVRGLKYLAGDGERRGATVAPHPGCVD